ncbi:MAG: uracil-DNA glycosylase [Candidatus Omnitrophica bacterium]|nr:uracil-DNA glycosylase [Candidatus Omnitrophota bacterium]
MKEPVETEDRRIENKLGNCQKCELYKTRTNIVAGEGNLNASILFIGEAPGANEDKTGHPFCGAAGKVLDELLNSAGISRNEVYIANILKCRPPQNRNPRTSEIQQCSVYLDYQIEIIKPKVICCLGNFSTAYILEKFGLKDKIEGISKIHGKIFVPDPKISDIKIVPLYHPAVVTYNVNMKGVLKADFKILAKI